MTRRTRKSGSNNKWLILIQIVIMAGVLVFIIFFRDTIGSGASSAFDTVAGTEDIEVKGVDESDESGDPPAQDEPEESSNEASDDESDAGAEPDDR